jgi:hypothetical protein
MNKRQKKKRRKKKRKQLMDLIRDTLKDMPPDAWCPPIGDYDVVRRIWGCPSLD